MYDKDSEGGSGLGAALITGGAALGAAGITYLGQSNLNKENRQWQAEQADIQRGWSEKMYAQQLQDNINVWNMQNAYNSPAAQKQRLIDAGMNPLYYGLDGSSAGGVQSAQPLAYERASYNAVQNPVSSAIDAAMKVVQAENIRANTAKQKQESITEVERRENLIQEREKWLDERRKLVASANLDDKQAAKVEQYLKFGEEIYQAQIDKEKSYTDLSKEQMNQIKELLPLEKELKSMSVKDFAAKWKLWAAEISHLCKQDALLTKQAKYYLLNLLESGVYGSGLSVVNGIILSEIQNDPDLAPDVKKKLEPIFSNTPSEKDEPEKVKPFGRPSYSLDPTDFDLSGLVPE